MDKIPWSRNISDLLLISNSGTLLASHSLIYYNKYSIKTVLKIICNCLCPRSVKEDWVSWFCNCFQLGVFEWYLLMIALGKICL